jgi:hypothetical protein
LIGGVQALGWELLNAPSGAFVSKDGVTWRQAASMVLDTDNRRAIVTFSNTLPHFTNHTAGRARSSGESFVHAHFRGRSRVGDNQVLRAFLGFRMEKPKANKKAHVASRRANVGPAKAKSARKATPAKKAPKGRAKAEVAKAKDARDGTKAAKILDLLKRHGGATSKERRRSRQAQMSSRTPTTIASPPRIGQICRAMA